LASLTLAAFAQEAKTYVPKTKIRTPTAAEAAVLRTQPPARPQTQEAPGGATGVLLDDTHTTFAVATQNADGSLSLTEVKGVANAKSAVAEAARAGKKPAPGKGTVHETR
jgi:hypothetical protein